MTFIPVKCYRLIWHEWMGRKHTHSHDSNTTFEQRIQKENVMDDWETYYSSWNSLKEILWDCRRGCVSRSSAFAGEIRDSSWTLTSCDQQNKLYRHSIEVAEDDIIQSITLQFDWMSQYMPTCEHTTVEFYINAAIIRLLNELWLIFCLKTVNRQLLNSQIKFQCLKKYY